MRMSEDMRKNFPNEFLHSLLEKNQVFQTYKNVFSREYFNFVLELVSQRQFTPSLQYSSEQKLDPSNNPVEYYDLELIKVGVIFLLTAIIRDKQRSGIIDFLPFIKARLSQVPS